MSDTLDGGTGDDYIDAGAGNDSVVGGTGDDSLIGGTGGDTLTGGTGADTFIFNALSDAAPSAMDTIVDFVHGDNDKIDLSAIDADVTKSGVQYFTFIGSSDFNAAGQVRFDALTKTLYATDNASNTPNFKVQMTGVSGLDVTDFIFGTSALSNVVYGTSSLIEGDTGANTLIGGNGDDVLNGYPGNDVLTDLSGSNKLFGGTDNDTLTAGAGADWLDGGTGNDRLYAGSGNDTLDAGTGDDYLDAGAGDDSLVGGTGDDMLIGGAGKDTLTGGTGADTFVFQTLADAAADVITDFNSVDGDRIDITGIDSNTVASGVQQNFSYLQSGSFTQPGQISFDAISHILSINTNTDDTPEVLIKLDGVSTLTLNDFTTVLSNITVVPANLSEGDTNDNILVGGSGDDVLNSYTGNDSLTDFSGNNKLFGGPDNDTLKSGNGNDWLDGGTGDDILNAGNGNNWLDASTGDDRLYSGVGVDTLYGGTGDDYLNAGAGNDFLDGGTGDDTLIGGIGKDTLLGGTGADTFVFQTMADSTTDIILDFNSVDGDKIDISTMDANVDLPGLQQNFAYMKSAAFTKPGQMYFDSTSQVLSINTNNDATPDIVITMPGVTKFDLSNVIFRPATLSSLVAGTSSLVEGNTLANTLIGGSSDDVLNGYSGNDVLTDLLGNNKLFGGTDNDTLTSGGGNDWLDGGTGDDALTSADGNDWLDAGTGDDKLFAGAGNDTLYGNTGDDYLEAGDGNDYLNGGTGDDVLIGGLGKDTLTGGTGADTFVFQTLSDTMQDAVTDFNAVDGDKLDFSGIDANSDLAGLQQNFALANNASFTKSGQLYFDATTHILSINTNTDAAPEFSIKLLGVSDFNLSNVLFTKPILSSIVDGTASLMASDTGVIEGNTLANTLTGGAGDDVLYGYTGNDVLTDLSGNNKLFGGTDNDTLTSGAGNDWLDGGTGNDILTGGEGNNWLDAAEGDDKLYTGAGDDTLLGGTGDDSLDAGTGDDLLNGGTGVDNLIGGMGRDIMTGGTGADIFTYNSLDESGLTADTQDVITDFVHSDGDKINVRGIDANVNIEGIQGFTYINTAKFSAAGQLRFDPSTNTLYASNNSDTQPEFSLTLTGMTTFQLSDLLY